MARIFPQRISVRLPLSFALLLLILCGLAAYAVGRIHDLGRESEQLVRTDLDRLLAVQSLHVHAESSAKELLVLLTGDRNQRVGAYARIDRELAAIDGLLMRLGHELTGPRIAEQLRVVSRCRDNYRSAYLANVDLIEADQDAAKQQFADTTQRTLDDFVTATAQLADMQQAAMVARQAASAAQIGRDRRGMITLAVLTVLVSAIVAWRVTRSIVRPLAQAEAAARRISKGDYSHHLAADSRSEVGRVGIAMNRMLDAIATRERTISRLAYHDPLTGLGNRSELLRQGEDILAAVRAAHGYAGLIHIDVKRLKSINEALGFTVGDACLIEIARRLASQTEGAGVLARLSGGSFALLSPAADAAEVDALMQRLVIASRYPADIDGHHIDLALVTGAAGWPEHGADVPALLRNAEIALYEAKRSQSESAWYRNEYEAIRLSYLSLLSDLDQAIAEDQLRLFVQPKLNLLTGGVDSGEALVRWQHPMRGFVSPAEFVPFAEQTGDIVRVTRWMLKRTLALITRLNAAGLPIKIAVNASARDIQDPAFPSMLAALVAESGAPVHLLRVEITESGLMRDAGQALDVMRTLRANGIELSIDDFGTGYSSLAYLQKLPVSELKIDRSFVVDVDKLPDAQKLLGSIVQLGLNMSLSITAEGVETEGELEVLRRFGCHTVQGYLFAKPMHEDALQGWLASRIGSQAPVDR